jgi:hypothetical protein
LQGSTPERVKSFNEQILTIRGFITYNKREMKDYLTVARLEANGKKLASQYLTIPRNRGPFSFLDKSYIRTETDYALDIVVLSDSRMFLFNTTVKKEDTASSIWTT